MSFMLALQFRIVKLASKALYFSTGIILPIIFHVSGADKFLSRRPTFRVRKKTWELKIKVHVLDT